MRSQFISTITGPLTNIPAGGRVSLNSLSGIFPLSPDHVFKLFNMSGGATCELAADTRLITLDTLSIGVNFLDAGGNFLTFIILAGNSWASIPIAFGNGVFVGVSGDPLVEIASNIGISTGGNAAGVQLSVVADAHNADAAAHRMQIFFAALVEQR